MFETYFEFSTETGERAVIFCNSAEGARRFARHQQKSGRIIVYDVNDEQQKFLVSKQEIDANGNDTETARPSKNTLNKTRASNRPRHRI